MHFLYRSQESGQDLLCCLLLAAWQSSIFNAFSYSAPEMDLLGMKAVPEAVAQPAHPAVLHHGCEEGVSWRGGACFKGSRGAPVAVSLAHTLCRVPRPVNAPAFVFHIQV